MPFSLARLWPGLPALWEHGRLAGFSAAVGWGLALNVALWTTFAEVAWLPGWAGGWPACSAAWFLVLGLWIVGFRANCQASSPPKSAQSSPEIDAWLVQAQTEYLKGHWLEAEALVAKILARQPTDVESRLLQASIFRRTQRKFESKELLAALAGDEAARRWTWEIQTELAQLDEEQTVASNTTESLSADSVHTLRRAA